jgi:hypothetical protein
VRACKSVVNHRRSPRVGCVGGTLSLRCTPRALRTTRSRPWNSPCSQAERWVLLHVLHTRARACTDASLFSWGVHFRERSVHLNLDGADLDGDSDLRAALRAAFRAGDVMLNMNVSSQWEGRFTATGLGLMRYEKPRMCCLVERCARFTIACASGRCPHIAFPCVSIARRKMCTFCSSGSNTPIMSKPSSGVMIRSSKSGLEVRYRSFIRGPEQRS